MQLDNQLQYHWTLYKINLLIQHRIIGHMMAPVQTMRGVNTLQVNDDQMTRTDGHF